MLFLSSCVGVDVDDVSLIAPVLFFLDEENNPEISFIQSRRFCEKGGVGILINQKKRSLTKARGLIMWRPQKVAKAAAILRDVVKCGVAGAAAGHALGYISSSMTIGVLS